MYALTGQALREKWLEARWGKHYEREKKALADLKSKYGKNGVLSGAFSVSNGSRDISSLKDCQVPVKPGVRIIDAVRIALQSEKTALLGDCDLEFEEGDSGQVTLVISGNRRNARKFVEVGQLTIQLVCLYVYVYVCGQH